MRNNRLFVILGGLYVFMICGCLAQQTLPAPTIAATQSPRIAPPATRSLVAIAGFENRSTYSADKLWDTSAQQLSTHLIKMGYFRVVEWEKMKRHFDWEALSTGSLINNPAHMDKARKILLCEYFISGAVTHFDVRQIAQASAISKKKTIDTRIGVELTLQNAQTGEYIGAGSGKGFVRQEFKGGLSGGQMGAWDPHAADSALSDAIEQALYEVTRQFNERAKPNPQPARVSKTAPRSYSSQSICHDGICQVESQGIAGVPKDYVDLARMAALRQAYRQAVGKVLGTEIGSLTVVENFKLISDVVTARSRGFLKNYAVIDEGFKGRQPAYYFVRIKADVLENGSVSEKEMDGLRLFVDLLENPKILIWIKEKGDPAAQNSVSGINAMGSNHISSAETAMAKIFSKAGFHTITSDELSDSAVADRKSGGFSHQALTIARKIDADVVIAGDIQLATRNFSPRPGVDMVMVSAELKAKPILVSSGKPMDVIHLTQRASHTDVTVAHKDCMTRLSQEFSLQTAWEIPAILAEEVRQIALIVENADLGVTQQIQKALRKEAAIASVTIEKIPTVKTPHAKLNLSTGYLRLTAEEMTAICQAAIGKDFQLVETNKHLIHICL